MDGDPEVLSDTTTNCNFVYTSESEQYRQAQLDTLEKKAVHLRLVLEKDFKAADIKWSMFVAAAFSFRYESCLRPFPPAFMKNGVKDMDELLSVITDVPALDLVLQQLDNLDNLAPYSDIINLLFYVLVRLKEPSIRTVPSDTHDAILATVHSITSAPKPQYIFQVCSSSKNAAEMKWRDLSKNHHLFYAYHGNRLENYYSLLSFGVQHQFNKSAFIGTGLSLSPELSTSLQYSPGGFGWGASCIGGHLSCVALCEVIDAPEGINYQKPLVSEGDGDIGSEGDKENQPTVTEPSPVQPFYVVSNYDLVRLRYLLIYAKQPASMRFAANQASRSAGSIRQWLAKHKLLSILLGYGLMIATIGFANNQPMQYYYKILLRKLDLYYSNVK